MFREFGSGHMTDGVGSMEASMVFEKLFSDYLICQQSEEAKAHLVRKLERLKAENPMLAGMQIEGNERVSINIREGSEYQVVAALSEAFDSLIDVAAFSVGQEQAFREAESVVSAVMKQFEDSFTRLGIKNYILKGHLAERLRSGVDGLNMILGGGFPRSEMILVSGPPGPAKHNLAFQFLAEGLRGGGSGMVVVSSMNVKEMRERLSRLGVNVPSCEMKGRLRTVDWNSQKSAHIIGMEERGPVLVPSKDIANLDIAFARAMDGLSFAPTTRAVVEMITQALNVYDLSEVIEFIHRQKTKFRERDIASIFVVEEGVHDERVMSTLKHMSDSVISLNADKDGKLFLEVEAMSTPNFRREKVAAQLSYKGISVVEQSVDEANVISEFCNIPLVTKEVAQKLVDAGFTDMNQLNRAEEGELARVNGITREIARSITEYTRTVEYSKSMLSSRSERWIKKAREQAAAGDLRKAKNSLERALEIEPANAVAHSELAELEGRLKNGDS